METFLTGPENLLQSQYILNNSIGMIWDYTEIPVEQNRKFRMRFYSYENLRYD